MSLDFWMSYVGSIIVLCWWSVTRLDPRPPSPIPVARVLRLGDTSVKHRPLPKCWHYECTDTCPICQWARR